MSSLKSNLHEGHNYCRSNKNSVTGVFKVLKNSRGAVVPFYRDSFKVHSLILIFIYRCYIN